MAKGKTHPSSWKSFERRVARVFGTERHSKVKLGDNVCDIIAPVRLVKAVILAIECKLTARLSKQVQDAIDQAERNYRSKRQLPIAVLKEKHDNDDEAIVCMRLRTFKRMVDM